MTRITLALVVTLFILMSPLTALAQSSSSAPLVTVPRLVHITGVFQPVDGRAPAAVEVVTLSIYAEPEGGLPLWQERQGVAVDSSGRFTLLLGASQPEGIPADVFGLGQAQWMSLLFERPGEVEQPRVRIASVPYALRASDADTLGGLPASAYQRALTPASVSQTERTPIGRSAMSAAEPIKGTNVVLPGTTNFLAKYVNGADVGNSAVYESGGAVGIGTMTPQDWLHVRFTNPNGATTGLAVQNLASTATAYSGMLFYDHNGVLGQFQGFNNTTHEYRINNVARNVSSVLDGSINFMIGGSSKFFVASGGNIGIGTTTPGSTLELGNVSAPSTAASLLATTFNNSLSSLFIGRKARGTPGAPAAVQGGDQLAFFGGRGYGTTGFTGSASGFAVRASEGWTDAAQGTTLQFSTTPNGTASPVPRMTLDQSGRLGIGTTVPQGNLEVVGAGNDYDVIVTSIQDEDAGALLLARHARGTQAAPSAVLNRDYLGSFFGSGYATTHWGSGAGLAAIAAENWTDTSQGAGLWFGATPLGSSGLAYNMVILPGGNVGVGTFSDAAPPTITDKLQVFGDIRIGMTGTDGCIKNFVGSGILGTCSSDRRFKRDITPFGPALGPLTALQPVYYRWRGDEFPDRNFGDSLAYGLIAQDVEQALPELVITDGEGFKAVDYSKLPLLTIQAVKELKAENDELKAGTESLKQRVAELERLVRELLVSAAHR